MQNSEDFVAVITKPSVATLRFRMLDDRKNADQMMPRRNAIECLVYADCPNIVRLATMLGADGVLESGDFFRLVIVHMCEMNTQRLMSLVCRENPRFELMRNRRRH